MKKSVPVSELKFGMYVAELDRPWTDTPFMFQGFVLRSEQQLEVLKKFCKSVLVDSERAELPDLPSVALGDIELVGELPDAVLGQVHASTLPGFIRP